MYRSKIIKSINKNLSKLQQVNAAWPSIISRNASTSNQEQSETANQGSDKSKESAEKLSSLATELFKNHKTTADVDEELRKKMAGLSGDGGEAGVEFEDGQPVAMKRSVKNNMFRYI